MDRKFWKGLILGIIAGALLVLLVLFISSSYEDQAIPLTQKAILETRMNSSCGLNKYAPVQIRGITVGKVETIELTGEPDHDAVKVTFAVSAGKLKYIALSNPDSMARADADQKYSYARVVADSPLGDSLLDIDPGRPDQVGQMKDGGLIRTVACSR